jgi:radical SAM superfamily enzyme YgiQ (UPF0313 family)
MTARGCPYNCSFCAQKQLTHTFAQRSPESVVQEMVQNYTKYKLRDFAFYDDALFINRDNHIKPILRNLITQKLPLRLHSPNGLFARFIDRELAELMYRSGFKTIRLSFETANENRHHDMSNKISNHGMVSAIEHLTAVGFNPNDIEAYIIMGLPDQEVDEVISSIIFINNLGVKVRLASYSPIPGTLDFSRAVDNDLISPDIDPLLTNKSIFPLQSGPDNYEVYRNLRTFAEVLNSAADKHLAPFANEKIVPGLKKVLRID